MGNSVTYIGTCVFNNCNSLNLINISESVSRIEKYAFKDCHSLTNIFIPNSVTTINYGAFWNCSSLKNITIPIKFKNSMKDIFTYIDLSKVNINYT